MEFKTDVHTVCTYFGFKMAHVVVMPRHTTHQTPLRHPNIVHTQDWSLIMLLILTVEQNHGNRFAMQIQLSGFLFLLFCILQLFQCSSHLTAMISTFFLNFRVVFNALGKTDIFMLPLRTNLGCFGLFIPDSICTIEMEIDYGNDCNAFRKNRSVASISRFTNEDKSMKSNCLLQMRFELR